MLINYRARREQIGGLLRAAGWQDARDKWGIAWYAPPGRGPRGPWSLRSAWKWHAMGEAFRELAKRGWDVPREFVGEVDTTTLGLHPKHPVKSKGKFVTLRTALRRENMPSLSSLMCLPLFEETDAGRSDAG